MESLLSDILASRPDPLDVLRTTALVVKNARQVHIDLDAIKRAADALVEQQTDPPPWNYEYHYYDGTARTVNYLFLLDALNFSFWGRPRWNIEHNGHTLDGYWALAAALKRGAEENPDLLKADYLARISPQDLKDVLAGRGQIPLFEARWKNARELGTVLRDHWEGEAVRLIRAAHNDAGRLAQLVADNFASFNDITTYGNREVRLFKRAQIVVADIWGSFGGRESLASDPRGQGTRSGAGASFKIKNIETLTAFADYKLPQILRAWGALQYTPQLERRIDQEMPLEASSPEEVEIRSATLWAVEFLRHELSERGKRLWSVQVDWILWEASQNLLPGMKPYHRVRSIYY